MAYPSTNQESHGTGFPKENVGPTPKKAGQIPEGQEKHGHLPGRSEPMPKPPDPGLEAELRAGGLRGFIGGDDAPVRRTNNRIRRRGAS